MKIWFFVEGHSEKAMTEQVLIKSFSSIHIEEDRAIFVELNEGSDEIWAHIVDCGSVDKIPHRINEYHHQIIKSGHQHIIILCDADNNRKCPVERIAKINSLLDSCVNKNNVYFSVNANCIEEIYWTDPSIIKRYIKIRKQEKFGGNPPLIDNPVCECGKYISCLKKLLTDHGLKYRESDFSDFFFPRLNFSESESHGIKRFLKRVSIIIRP